MSLQTVFVTNRILNTGKDAKKHLFGNKLSKHEQIHFASAVPVDKEKIKKKKLSNKITRTTRTIKKTYTLALKSEEQRSDYLKDIIANSDNGRPWVFFLHGNNQTLSKNLVKSRVIQEQYQVNLVIFSWPSRSYEPEIASSLILAGLLATNPSTLLLSAWFGKNIIKKKARQYNIARGVAKKTAPQFSKAYAVIRDELLQPLQDAHNPHTCFLTHSLGHHVLRTLAESDSPLPGGYKFNTCMLHQADEENDDHQSWAVQLPLVEQSNTYVTRNKLDTVLLVSGVVNNDFDFGKGMTRLGNRSNHDSEQGSPLNYVEFSGLDEVGLGHGVAWDDGRSAEVDALCRPILTGAP